MSTILIIDDTAQLRDFIAECLKYEGYTVITARDGPDGVRAALQHLPDLIICDVMMPGLDGYGVLEKLRGEPATAHIPFIFLTALASPYDRQEGINLGASDYLIKPFMHVELLGAIEAKLGPRPANV